MILELLEWCLTPASVRARASGLLAEQIAIRHRAARCRSEWQKHLEASREFVTRNLPAGNQVAVLGSGHLNDVDLRILKKKFERVTLVDAVHPFDVRFLTLFSKGRIRLFSTDLSGALHLKNPSDPLNFDVNLERVLKESDALVSTCVLTQLALPLRQRWKRRFSDGLVAFTVSRISQAHFDAVKESPSGILISDTARRFGQDPWEELLPNLDRPAPEANWVWDIAPVREHGLAHLGGEQRLVEAFVFGKSRLQREILCPNKSAQ